PPTPPHPSAHELQLTYRPLDHGPGKGEFHLAELALHNRGRHALPNSGWRLYFNYRGFLAEGEGNTQITQTLDAQGIRIHHADAARSGDYFVLEPTPASPPLPASETRRWRILVPGPGVLKSDAPAGFHIVFDEEPKRPHAVHVAVELDPHDPRQTTAHTGDHLPVPTPQLRFATHPLRVDDLSLAERLLPTPLRVRDSGRTTHLILSDTALVHADGLASEAAYLAGFLRDYTGVSIQPTLISTPRPHPRRHLALRINPKLDVDRDGQPDPEAYRLRIDRSGDVSLVGSDAAGCFYAIQTLRQLVAATARRALAKGTSVPLPVVLIEDAPRFRYRGMHLDVSRHFVAKETVMRLLDLLAYHKINKLHLHLTDDEGWRLEIPGIEELTSFGAQRGFDPEERVMLHAGLGAVRELEPTGTPATMTTANGGTLPNYQGFEPATLNFVGRGSGYYTTQDFEDIVRYASERHIEVIPEIDVPGHSRAAVLAMEYRYRKYAASDPQRASEYRLIDPEDTSAHRSVQGYTDNFLNPCLESSWTFLRKVVSEIRARYDAVQGATLAGIHGGGDELPSKEKNIWWRESPACDRTRWSKSLSDGQIADEFFRRWYHLIQSNGLDFYGWDDLLHIGGGALDLRAEAVEGPGLVATVWANVWGWGREDDAYKLANRGYKVVLAHATNLYLDLAYNKDPDEPGYYWAGFVDTRKTFEYRPFDVFAHATLNMWGERFPEHIWKEKESLRPEAQDNILGLQGLLWTETVKTPEMLEYYAFPKMLGVAERAWSRHMPTKAEIEPAWQRFANGLGQAALPRLDRFRAVDLRDQVGDAVGVNYRLPLPGARVLAGKLQANIAFPGLAIEYSLDNGSTWNLYTRTSDIDVHSSRTTLLRSRGRRDTHSRVATVEPKMMAK
ncbi:MAG: family 20 glycosylhydrolase, partial [Nannocystaceae bacterium]